MYDGTAQHATLSYKFTGKERDSESGLDEFGARYYASPLGRFMTPDWAAKPTDVPYANFGNPQSLNLYSYVQNNPTTVGDPDGHSPECLVEEIVEDVAIAHPEATAAVVGAAEKVGEVAEAGASTALRSTLGVVGFIFLASQQTANEQQDTINGHANSNQEPEPQTSSSGAGARQGGGKPGEVYVTEPQQSGKPYVGRTTQGVDKRMATRTDGRTGKANTVDTYKTTHEGRVKEQQQIDKHGLKNLDNKRNEIRKPKPKKPKPE